MSFFTNIHKILFTPATQTQPLASEAESNAKAQTPNSFTDGYEGVKKMAQQFYNDVAGTTSPVSSFSEKIGYDLAIYALREKFTKVKETVFTHVRQSLSEVSSETTKVMSNVSDKLTLLINNITEKTLNFVQFMNTKLTKLFEEIQDYNKAQLQKPAPDAPGMEEAESPVVLTTN